MLAGVVFGMVGFGGVGVATARLMRCIGMRIHAINRRGMTDEPWTGSARPLSSTIAACRRGACRRAADARDEGMIGRRELGLMRATPS